MPRGDLATYRLRIDGADGLTIDRGVDRKAVLSLLALDEWTRPVSAAAAPGPGAARCPDVGAGAARHWARPSAACVAQVRAVPSRLADAHPARDRRRHAPGLPLRRAVPPTSER